MTTLTHFDLTALLAAITHPGYTFHFREIVEPYDGPNNEHCHERTGFLLWAEYSEPDIITGEPSRQVTRKWYISSHACKSEIVQTALKCVLTSAEHRVREHFKYKGQRVYGPHFDADALAELAGKKRLDYRKQEA